MNLVILAGIIRVFRSMRDGTYNEAELEAQLQNRGLMYRFFGKWMRSIDKEWKLYPVGVVFGMGFDTATEVALLATTALFAAQHLPWYSIMCLPILFTAGMVLMDTIDCLFMNVAYGWAFFNPVRKIFYNLAITGLSVAICFFIGAVEVLGLLPDRTPLEGFILALDVRLRHQQGRHDHRRNVRRHLVGRRADLALRPHRREVGFEPSPDRRSRCSTVRNVRSATSEPRGEIDRSGLRVRVRLIRGYAFQQPSRDDLETERLVGALRRSTAPARRRSSDSPGTPRRSPCRRGSASPRA